MVILLSVRKMYAFPTKKTFYYVNLGELEINDLMYREIRKF